MYDRFFTILWTGTYSAAIDFEINMPSGTVGGLVSVDVSQSSDAGDAEDEQIPCTFIRTHSTSGSGGSSFTALPTLGGAAFGGTCEIANTTLATGGSPVTWGGRAFNVRAGHSLRPTEDEQRQLRIASGERAVVRLPNAPADGLTAWVEIVFGVVGA